MWLIGAVVLVVVVALTATISVYLTKNSGDSAAAGTGAATSSAPPDVASANDKGPVGIITEDPSCAAWTPVNTTLYELERKGWMDRDLAALPSSWTPELRAQYEAVAKGMRAAADQTVPLSKLTTHRVLRELYGQFITYVRAYADSLNNLSTFTPIDEELAKAGSTAANTITHICAAASFGSAASRAALVPTPPAPTSTAPIGDVSNPAMMFTAPDPVCPDLNATLITLLENPTFKEWVKTDPKITRANWTPELASLNEAVLPIMSSTADALEKLAAKSSNPVVQDFILLGVLYRRTYVKAMATYQPNDGQIYLAGQMAPGVILGACDYLAGRR